MAKQILLSITTTNRNDWRARIREAVELGIKELALFPTCLGLDERQEMYKALEESGIKSIPFCHLRSDMMLEELDFLVEKYRTKAFNTHMQIEYPRVHDWSKYRKIIFIEPVYHKLDEKELKDFAGICPDFSHFEDDRLLHQDHYEHNVRLLEDYPVGCNHISAITKDKYVDQTENYPRYHRHCLKDLSELDYLQNYSEKFFGEFIALEVENKISEQLRAREYISKIIK